MEKCKNCKHWIPFLTVPPYPEVGKCENPKVKELVQCEDPYCGLEYNAEFLCKFYEKKDDI